MIAFCLLLAFAGLKENIALVIATGTVGIFGILGGAVMQLVSPEPDKPYNAHKSQLDHDAHMAEIELEKMRLQSGMKS